MRTENDLRAALAALESEAPDAGTVLSAIRQGAGHSRRSAARRAAVRRWRAPGLAAVAAIATTGAVLAATSAPGGTGAPPAAGASVPAVISGGPVPLVFRPQPGGSGLAGGTAQVRHVLLTAARKAAQQPPTSGRYWKVTNISGNFRLVGPGRDPYLILEVNRQETVTRIPDGAVNIYEKPLGVLLGSPAARAAWRRAGSPTSWPFGPTNGLAEPNGQPFEESPAGPLPDTAGKLKNTFGDSGGGSAAFVIGSHAFTRQELLTLPARPGELRRLLLSGHWRQSGDGTRNAYLFAAVPEAIQLPVSNAVRSALYEVLAGLHGMRSLGIVRDAGGQQGEAIAVSSRQRQCGDPFDLDSYRHTTGRRPQLWPTCTVQQRIVISQETGLPIAAEERYTRLPAGPAWPEPGGLFSYEIFGPARWARSGWPKNS